jgi:hypothetical protein
MSMSRLTDRAFLICTLERCSVGPFVVSVPRVSLFAWSARAPAGLGTPGLIAVHAQHVTDLCLPDLIIAVQICAPTSVAVRPERG